MRDKIIAGMKDATRFAKGEPVNARVTHYDCAPMQTVIDIWGGERDMEHLARFLRHWDAAAQSLVSRELANGFLVNVRRELAWGDDHDFDNRQPGDTGLN